MTLPEYQIRHSTRAKYIRLLVHPDGALEVVLPQGVARSEARKLVEKERDWIEKTWVRLKEKGEAKQAGTERPHTIELRAIHEVVSIAYLPLDGVNQLCRERDGKLQLFCGADDVRHVLQDWLKYRAKRLLPDMLAEVAQEMGERYSAVSIRLQKTRWGSCSSKRNINLNAKLLLLPPDLVRHVLIHELAHLKHLNHSKAFWQQVERFEPDYRENRQRMREQSHNMPAWTHPTG